MSSDHTQEVNPMDDGVYTDDPRIGRQMTAEEAVAFHSPAESEPDRGEMIRLIEQWSFDICEPLYYAQRMERAGKLYDTILSKFKVTKR